MVIPVPAGIRLWEISNPIFLDRDPCARSRYGLPRDRVRHLVGKLEGTTHALVRADCVPCRRRCYANSRRRVRCRSGPLQAQPPCALRRTLDLESRALLLTAFSDCRYMLNGDFGRNAGLGRSAISCDAVLLNSMLSLTFYTVTVNTSICLSWRVTSVFNCAISACSAKHERRKACKPAMSKPHKVTANGTSPALRHEKKLGRPSSYSQDLADT